MSATGPFFVTPHALRAWRERVEGAQCAWSTEAEYRRSLRAMIDDLVLAHYVRPARNGADLWRGPSPRRARFIIGGEMRGAKRAVVTVLAEHDEAAC